MIFVGLKLIIQLEVNKVPKYIESERLELKEKYSDTICKEIVAFLNTMGGTIIIGVKDDGEIVGVDKIDEIFRKISDIITGQIEPNPQDEVSSELRFEDGKVLIVINIAKGMKHIYCQKKYGFSSIGCPIRVGTTCKEMTAEQIKIRYESRFSDGEYNLLAELLADRNNIPFIFVKFKGRDKSVIFERSDYGYRCILTSYEQAKNRLQAENICISDTTVRPRKDTYLYDFDSVNEAVLNALVHNDWMITEPQISMFEDRLEILSHGGLPNGLTKKQFYDGISKPRNVTLMRIFLNMGLVEHTGHGIPTIVKRYGEEVFEIEDNYILCTIPFNREVMSKTKAENIIMNNSIDTDLNKTEKK